MPYPTEEFLAWQPLANGGVRFTRYLLDQEWQMTVRPDGFVTLPQAAMLLGVSLGLVVRWVREKRLPEAGVMHYPTLDADEVIYMLSLEMVKHIAENRAEYGAVGPMIRP